MIYKFRMLLGDNEDFVRDFEMRSVDSFKDFHSLITKNVKLGSEELASFFICDGQWTKLEEITLIDMSSDIDQDEEEKKEVMPAIMSEVFLKDKISDPHQRMIYEYDFLNTKTFYLELIKISKETAGVKYPICTFSQSDMGKVPQNEKMLDINEDTLLEDFNDLLNSKDSGFEIDDYSDSDY